MSNNAKKLNMLLISACFLLPVLLAYIVLKMGWFNPSSTNKGELLSPLRSHHLAIHSTEKKWLVMYQVPEVCNQQCQNNLYVMQQTHTALGKNQDRVSTVAINASSQLVQGSHLLGISVADISKLSFMHDSPQALYIADPMGNVMMRYQISEDKQQAIMAARDLLKDLNKMLKLSKVG
ncbi:hypothetical protein C2869_09730 [Saccharobesus litoralis]|uniref:Uncharacterized protein n=1 Tax=Saccharobesus litoralis TaxID=2172099 RepID=A0A2S0VR84_9ALTE|nr:hypothetical protein [Saccharobesus litoralis]AWB66692.1 hypothetical protein C2869_09730 [Saccharobesus litoralis]